MKNKNVCYSEFLRAYKRNLVKHSNLICYKFGNHFWFYSQKMVWSVDLAPIFEDSLSLQIKKIGTLQEELPR